MIPKRTIKLEKIGDKELEYLRSITPAGKTLDDTIADIIASHMSEGYIEVEEAARVLHTTPAEIRKKVFRREIPFHKPFGRLLFVRSELDAIVRKARVPAKSELKADAIQALTEGKL